MSNGKIQFGLLFQLLITLLTGSINSEENVGKELPQSTLEKVKQNIVLFIVLFDGDQTRFIFNERYIDKIIKVKDIIDRPIEYSYSYMSLCPQSEIVFSVNKAIERQRQ